MTKRFKIYNETDEVVLDYLGDFSLPGYSEGTTSVSYSLLGIITGNQARRSSTLRRLTKLLNLSKIALQNNFGYVWFQYDLQESGRTLIRSGSLEHQDGLDFTRTGSFVTINMECNPGFEIETMALDLGAYDQISTVGGHITYSPVDERDFVRIGRLDFEHDATGVDNFVKFLVGTRRFNYGTRNFRSSFPFEDMPFAVAYTVSDTNAVGGQATAYDLGSIYTDTGLYSKSYAGVLTFDYMFDSLDSYSHQFGMYNLIVRYKMNSSTVLRYKISTDPACSNIVTSGFLTNTGSIYGQVVLPKISIPTCGVADGADLNDALYFFTEYIAGDHVSGEFVYFDELVFMPVDVVEITTVPFNGEKLRIEQLPNKTVYSVVEPTSGRYVGQATGVGNIRLSPEGGVVVIYGTALSGLAKLSTAYVTGELIYGHSGF